MVYMRTQALCENEPKSISLAWATALVIGFCALGVRAVEASDDSLGFTRVLVSACALGAFFLMRRFSFAKSLLCAVAIEAVSGSALFALVDYPFIAKHGPEIGRMTVMTLERLERRSVPSSVKLARV